MAGADIRRFSIDRRGMPRNFFLGVANGALLILADTLIHPLLVLALFVSQLTDSYLLIGLVPAISSGVWFAPQLVAAALLRGRRRQLPWATGASLVRTAAIALLAYVGYRADSMSDAQLLRSFFICYIAYNLAAGFANVPATEVAARAIAAERRALFFSQRNLWGGLLGFVAGLAARRVLGSDGPDFPRNYTLLFVASAAGLLAATFFQGRMREPIRLLPSAGPSITRQLREGPRALVNPNLRRFLLFRVLLSLSAVADPFFIVYAQRELGAPASIVGTYLVLLTLARLGSNPLWSRLNARLGHKAVLQYAALVRLLAPLVALILPYVIETDLYRDRVADPRVAYYAFGTIFVAYGAALSGQILSNLGYTLAIVPEDRLPSSLTLLNLILAVVAFVPVAGGSLVNRFGFETLFVVAAFVGLASVFVSGALTDTHAEARSVAQTWGLRRARP